MRHTGFRLRTKKKSNKIILIFIVFITLSFLSNRIISNSIAQSNGQLVSVSSNLQFFEYSQVQGKKENVSSINIKLSEANWTLNYIQVNFSDISLSSEIKTIEDTETGLEQVWNKNSVFRTFALATQIEILERTELYGVFIKGYKTPEANETILFQIQGFDESNNSPNNTVHRTIDLNISTSLDWYYQDFSSEPITLLAGNYSLVMNGTNLVENPNAKYFWAIDDEDPQNKEYYTSSYVDSWNPGIVNTSFLCTLNQSVNRTYFPTDINMTAEFNEKAYEIIDGPIKGKGYLEIPNLSYVSEETNLNILILINETFTLNFNFNYSINSSNEFLSDILIIIEESHNHCSISPTFSRISQNYFIKFNIPKSWYNFSIYRKLSSVWENVTSLINIDLINRFIIIPNSTIEEGSEWKIIAYSPTINFDLNFPITKWELGQELQFSVDPPMIQGNLTFVLINTLGFSQTIQVKEVTSDETLFTYNIPTNFLNGTYTAKIYWNNITDAGVQSQIFSITIPETPPPPDPPELDPIPAEPIDPLLIIGIIIASVGATVSVFVSYRLLKSYRDKRAAEELKIFNKCMDVLKLDYLMVTDKKSGLNIYEQKFTTKMLNGTLISGFLQAIHQFGIELIKVEDQSQTIKLEYANSIVIMTEFVNFRLILIMKESPSRNFLYSLEDLAYDIYQKYGKLVEDFKGDIKPFKGIEELLRKHLNISFIYPLKLAAKASSEVVKIHQDEREYINKALSFMRQTKNKHFYIGSLLPEKRCSPKDIEYIMDLIDKEIFLPIYE